MIFITFCVIFISMKDKKAESGLPRRLKELRADRKMTQKDVARHLGIGQSAVANYEQGLRFPDERILKGLSSLFNVSIDFLLGNTFRTAGGHPSPSEDTSADPEALGRVYLDLIMGHRREEAVHFLTGALDQGLPLVYLYHEVLIPALRRTGELWERGLLDVAEEHAVSEEVERAAGILSFLSPRAAPLDARCVCAAAGPELHSIGTRMVSDLLGAAGWDSRFLGVNTPLRDILAMGATVKADLLVLSATMDGHIESVKSIVSALREDPALAACRVLVGGGAFVRNPQAWKAVGADAFAKDLPEALEAAARLLEEGRASTS